MARRVGRPSRPYERTAYTEEELLFIYSLLKSSSNIELKNKVKYDLKERKRLTSLYEKAKDRVFGKDRDKH